MSERAFGRSHPIENQPDHMLENLRRSIVMQQPGSMVELRREEALRIIELAQQTMKR